MYVVTYEMSSEEVLNKPVTLIVQENNFKAKKEQLPQLLVVGVFS